jgi:uncharacterized SAM-binding protein YcdF (DUF218 family)
MTDEVRNAAHKIWEWLPISDSPAPSDIIFVLGNKSDALPAEAANLYGRQLAPLIVLSGGYGRLTKHDELTEAGRYLQALRQYNIPAADIIVEDQSTNTGENIKASKALLASKGLSPRVGIAVTTAMLSRRHQATLQKLWPEVRWLVHTPVPVPYEERMRMENAAEFFNLMVGEVIRLQYYPAKGFMDAIAVPDDIIAATEVLVSAGYTKYQIKP